jgi:putative restriction endonuclease
MDDGDLDHRVRLAGFAFLAERTRLHGEVLPYATLQQGFVFDGRRVPLLGPQGIFKPAVLPEMPLSITTAPVIEGKARPYEDEVDRDGLITYRYRGTDPQHHENVGLRRAMQTHTPLIYLYGVTKGSYLPVWPAFIVGDDPATLSFRVAVDDVHAIHGQETAFEPEADARRKYVTVLTQRRLHQRSFRERVLDAYRRVCAICRLRHDELLDAAHILPDTHPKGDPVVRNGLSLCKLHHAAFDENIIGIRTDLHVEVRLDILEERDGPMLRYGLQEFQGAPIIVPRAEHLRPATDLLAERYAAFKKAS